MIFRVPRSALWPSDIYPQEFINLLSSSSNNGVDPTRPGLLTTSLGYGYSSGNAEYAEGYFVATLRKEYDFVLGTGGGGNISIADPAGTIRESRNSLGKTVSIINYDALKLLPVEFLNSALLSTRVINDYDVQQPGESYDFNGNRTHYEFTPLGLLKTISVMGKENENEGDSIDKPSITYQYNFHAVLDDDTFIYNWTSF